MRPKKRLGQHFLIDKNIIRKIIAASGVAKGDHILEIGPGDGALTGAFIEKGANVLAIEIDRGLCEKLKKRFSGEKRFTLINADALKVSFLELSREYGAKFKVVSNLPYNISGPVVVKFMEEREAFTTIVIMLQKEVARRITAMAGSKDYGIISVLTQAYAQPVCEFDVSPNSFRPRPKVTSTVVSFTFLVPPFVKKDLEGAFKRIVKGAFSRRRKTLLNSLKTLGMADVEILNALNDCAIDPKRRGETLSLKEFLSLTERLKIHPF